ncbi:PRC-barrel domain-containing protein [Deinococcus cellulosilyticus]|uniref:PRC-barrel domain-containing protein n=1 Tax=Deinococcus cellulosilyticus (strain DSM 18568 / NBRC 106333 / KACC 11606 / 5516J-15) TaxID=1223518 RepID=A0A511N1V4_DEIC1|nr:PRC-barrel domain-containing protein [Deinococcus cellulosilyticus]GEM46830.1 hypothetical protein DC3_24650 [Deinococcus cellulosilyticus NBRC 106333 = KACC 11606]
MLTVKTLMEMGEIHTPHRKIGSVVDVVINHQLGRVIAYLVRSEAFHTQEAVLFDALMYHSEHRGYVQSSDDVVPLIKLPRLQALAEEYQVIGKPWLDFEGREIGTIEDISFDGQTGYVMYYKIKFHPHVPVVTPMMSAALSPFRGQ